MAVFCISKNSCITNSQFAPLTPQIPKYRFET